MVAAYDDYMPYSERSNSGQDHESIGLQKDRVLVAAGSNMTCAAIECSAKRTPTNDSPNKRIRAIIRHNRGRLVVRNLRMTCNIAIVDCRALPFHFTKDGESHKTGAYR
jgi:hypothetical protein